MAAIKVPERLRPITPDFITSSDGDGSLSRTVAGLVGFLVFFGAQYTPLTEADLTGLVNELLVALTAVYGVYGLIMKLYNKWRAE